MHILVRSTLCWALAIASATPALAQSDTPATGESTQGSHAEGEIIVTANKREQNIQRVGIAVTALGQDQLAGASLQDVTSLAKQIPSFQIAQFSPTATVLNIRGVSQNDYADSQEAPIAFYSDGVYISALGAIGGMNYDLERIEVLRGPQGTLFGRNATGGLVQIISAKPTDTFEGYLTATFGSYGQVGAEGAVSGALSDNVRSRLSFITNHGGAYMKNLTGKDLGGNRFYAGRFQLAGDVGESDNFLIKLQYMRNDHERRAGLYTWSPAQPDALGQGVTIGPDELGQFPDGAGGTYTTCLGCDAFGYKQGFTDTFKTAIDGPSMFDRTFWSATLTYNKDFGWGQLTSITDYQRLKKDYADDQDMTPGHFFHYDTRQRFWQLSQELRLAGDVGPLKWLVGAYGIKIDTRSNYHADLVNAFGADVYYNSYLRTKSAAVFSQLEYELSHQFTLIGGLRYSWDEKRYDFTNDLNGSREFTFNPAIYPDLARQTYKNWSGKIELDFKPNDDTLVYLTANRGTKSGGFGTPAFGPFDPATLGFGQEVLTNYEGGVKLTLFGGSSRLNISGFRYIYRDYQSYESLGISLVLRNQQARVAGAEVEFFTRPLPGLSLQAFGSYLDAKVLNVGIPGTGIITDRRMPNAPKWSLGGMLRYEFDIAAGEIALQTNWKYNSSSFFNVFNEPVNREPSYTVGDVRITFKPANTPLELALFANNVTNKHYRVFSSDLSTLSGSVQSTFAPPRWLGGSVTIHFN